MRHSQLRAPPPPAGGRSAVTAETLKLQSSRKTMPRRKGHLPPFTSTLMALWCGPGRQLIALTKGWMAPTLQLLGNKSWACKYEQIEKPKRKESLSMMPSLGKSFAWDAPPRAGLITCSNIASTSFDMRNEPDTCVPWIRSSGATVQSRGSCLRRSSINGHAAATRA